MQERAPNRDRGAAAQHGNTASRGTTTAWPNTLERRAPSRPDWHYSFRRSVTRYPCGSPDCVSRVPRPEAGCISDSESAAQGQIRTRKQGGSQHGQRIHRHMPAGQTELVGDFLFPRMPMHAPPNRPGAARQIDQPGVGLFLSAPNETIRVHVEPLLPPLLRRANCGFSRFSTAAPPPQGPRKISALASAIASTMAKNSRCTGSTVVITAICGRTIFTSGSISPA